MTTLDSIQTILADDEAPSINKKRGTECFRPANDFDLSAPGFNEATEYQVNLASAISQTLRRDLRSIIPYPSNPVMHDRMKKTLTEYVQWGTIDPEYWVTYIGYMNTIHFTRGGFPTDDPWTSSFKVVRVSPRLVRIKIPAFTPKDVFDSYNRAKSVKCKIAMSVLFPQTGTSIACAQAEFEFPFNDSKIRASVLPVKIPTPKMSILVTGLSMEFKTNHKYVMTNKEKGNFTQASIINAMGV